jgi:rhodanese-related sulfurtransferase
MPWAMLSGTPAVQEIDLEVLEARPSDAVVLDVREPEEYAHGHVPGAVSLPQADLASRLAEVPRDRPVLTLCERGMRSLRAAQFLLQVGIEQVASVKGGTAAWRAAGKPLAVGDTSVEKSRVTESEWTHAGARSSYRI